MKRLIAILSLFVCTIAFASDASAAIKRIKGYTRRDGTRVQSHYRDTSNDGNRYNNANYLGYND